MNFKNEKAAPGQAGLVPQDCRQGIRRGSTAL
jgi:hypothetical protein